MFVQFDESIIGINAIVMKSSKKMNRKKSEVNYKKININGENTSEVKMNNMQGVSKRLKGELIFYLLKIGMVWEYT